MKYLSLTEVLDIFKICRKNYDTRKIKVELKKRRYLVSSRRIGRIIKQKGLVSSYTGAQFKPHIDRCNESKAANLANRKFDDQPYLKVVVSDLTYGRVGSNWHYICVLIDTTLLAFGISRSLSMKGCPYNNAVAEATFKIIKTEFFRNHTFVTLNDLNYQLADYVNWFNNCRIHHWGT